MTRTNDFYTLTGLAKASSVSGLSMSVNVGSDLSIQDCTVGWASPWISRSVMDRRTQGLGGRAEPGRAMRCTLVGQLRSGKCHGTRNRKGIASYVTRT
jgi:hypothetical protein